MSIVASQFRQASKRAPGLEGVAKLLKEMRPILGKYRTTSIPKAKLLFLAVALILPHAICAAETIDRKTCTIADTTRTAAPAVQGVSKKGAAKSKENNEMFLSRVVCEVEKALDAYQQSEDVADKGILPQLASADFEFKTVVATKGGITVSFLIFKFGTTIEKQDTNDVDFQYVPKRLTAALDGGRRAESLQEALIKTIRSAARAIVEQSSMPHPAKDPLVFKQLSVTLSYGVTWDVNGGVNAPISLVTVGPSIDHSKNNVQQVKLVFAPPPSRDSKKMNESE